MKNKKSSSAVICNLCGNSRYYLVYKKPVSTKKSTGPYNISESHLEKPNKIVRCMTCNLVYAYPTSGEADKIIEDYVSSEDAEYVREEAGRRAQAKKILQSIAKYKKPGNLLDIGCGPGFLLDEARKAGWNVSGVELSQWSRDYCKKQFGISVVGSTFKEAGFEDRSFDAVVINDVIEHVFDPMETLSEIRRILKTDGILYLSTPDISSFWSKLLRAKWWGINKYHLYYFSRKTMEQYFQKIGFKKIQYLTYPRIFSLRYWTLRLKPYPAFIRLPFECLANLGNLGNALLKIDLFDQIGVIAKKIQRLDSLDMTVAPRADSSHIPHKKVVAVLPAYNAAKTLERTVADIPKDSVHEIILVDDVSKDDTVKIAKKLGLHVYVHEKNGGYGANQKTCYQKAIELGADIAVMVHPDYQYDPRIIPQLIEPILKGEADAVFGSRMMKGGALEGGMPPWKYKANILLTAFENVVLGTYLTEYHSGFRAYSTHALRKINLKANSDNFVFDTEIIVQLLANHMRIDEVPIRTRYFEEASSIRFLPSVIYGLSILKVMLSYTLHVWGIRRSKQFEPVTNV